MDPMRIIMRFSRQHKQIHNIIEKHWSILTDNDKVKYFISPVPSITFKRVASLKDKVVKSEYRKTNKKHCSTYGTFPCGHCAHCLRIRKEKVFTFPNGQVFKPKHFINCQTPAVVYLMTCECSAFMWAKRGRGSGAEHPSISIVWRQVTSMSPLEDMWLHSITTKCQKLPSPPQTGFKFREEAAIAIKCCYKLNRNGYRNLGPLHIQASMSQFLMFPFSRAIVRERPVRIA